MDNKKELNKTKQQIHYKKVVEWNWNIELFSVFIFVIFGSWIGYVFGLTNSWLSLIFWNIIWLLIYFMGEFKDRKVYWVMGE